MHAKLASALQGFNSYSAETMLSCFYSVDQDQTTQNLQTDHRSTLLASLSHVGVETTLSGLVFLLEKVKLFYP